MKKLFFLTIALLFVGVIGFVAKSVMATDQTVVIKSDVRQNGILIAKKTRTVEANGNFLEETVYFSSTGEQTIAPSTVGIVGDGVYTVKKDEKVIYLESDFPKNRIKPISKQNTDLSILGYPVIKREFEDGANYYSPDLNAVLKYEFQDDVVIEATEIVVGPAPTVVLPKLPVNYDEYKRHINGLLKTKTISQADADVSLKRVPENVRFTSVALSECEKKQQESQK